jgi:hypothetical protein
MPKDVSMAAFVNLVNAGGSLIHGKTTGLLEGAYCLSALTNAHYASPCCKRARGTRPNSVNPETIGELKS